MLISSLKYSKLHPTQLAFGNVEGSVKLIDTEKSSLIYDLGFETTERISSIDWCRNILSNGTKEGEIYLRDIRDPRNIICKFTSHKEEICSFSFNPINRNYLLSGGNDDTVYLYDLRKMKEFAKIEEHKAAVKAMAWSNQNSN